MRILHVIPSLAVADGGPTTVVKELSRVARGRGDNLKVITTDKGLATTEPRVPGAQYARSLAPRRWTFSPQLVLKIWKALPETDVVHIHSVHTFPTLAAAVLSMLRRRPYVVEPHGALDAYHMKQRRLLKTLYFWTIDRPVLWMASGLIVSSTRERDDALDRLPSRKPIIIPLGVDEDLFHIDFTRARQQTAVFIGRLAEKKGIDLLLQAWPTVAARLPKANLILAGPIHRDLPESTARAVRHLYGEGIVWLGAVDRTERNRLLQTCGVLVLPSRDESFGIAVAEAMAAGVPVIVSADVGISSEVVTSGAGFVVARESGAIARALIEALSEDMSPRGLAARRVAEKLFRWTTVYDRMQALYRIAMVARNDSQADADETAFEEFRPPTEA